TCCIARDVEQWGAVAFEPSALMERSFQEIDASDIVLVDLTEKGVGIGIEAGYAFAKHIPIITIAQVGSSISTTLQGISQHIFLYSQYAGIAKFLATIQR
ncbi:MAG: nucleoside 2-deoxyribosyltransferase, partial [bacterium]|nr:nucleoside 2-deoxyribosyltransferase [bacterium]